MAEWVWEARARTGETKKGTMEAETADAVQGKLRAQNLNPVKVKKKADRDQDPDAGLPAAEGARPRRSSSSSASSRR